MRSNIFFNVLVLELERELERELELAITQNAVVGPLSY